MKRLFTALSLVVVLGSASQAQVIWDSGPGPSTTLRPQSGQFAGQEFFVGANQLLTQFGFYGHTLSGGVFKFFVADAANNVIHSGIVTLPSTNRDEFAFVRRVRPRAVRRELLLIRYRRAEPTADLEQTSSSRRTL